MDIGKMNMKLSLDGEQFMEDMKDKIL